jgi:hypothetical protein
MTLDSDMCRECAADAGTPWPAGAKAPYTGPCHWCGNGERAVMPMDDLEETDFVEMQGYA